ncbi:MAG: SUMF1/EgtB/PvdO family nonheme iron enzyme [Treponema sp.]|nr:SUMF1/EgtB/PvdO family nonheme iron enzyme [Treponema sp.]
MREREKQAETDDQVKLKPFLGIKAGIWLTGLYSLILLAALFLLLVYPGLRNPGAVLSIKTEPEGAAIRVNGIYMGTSGSGSGIFVSKGQKTIEAVLPGFESQSAFHEIPGRVFGSLFFPLRYQIEFNLKTRSPSDAFARSAADFAAWTFGGEPTAVWQIPLSLSEGAYRIGPEHDPASKEILNAASRFTVTRAALRDLVRAKFLMDSGGLSASAANLAGSVTDILHFLSESPNSAEWLSDLLPPETAVIVRNSDWYKNTVKTDAAIQQNTSETRRMSAGELLANERKIAGLSFINFANNGFMISVNPVPGSLYKTFLNENPEFDNAAQNEIFPKAMYEKEDITGVTWYAAQAFCNWLTENLPSSMADMEARLPTESEWEYAAGYEDEIINMRNTGWEWCLDPYAPLPFFSASQKAIQAVGSPERTLKRKQLSASSPTRASLPPDFSSPYVTFRPVISRRNP